MTGADKRVLLAKPRGYCAGVDRAVEAVERALEQHGAPVYVRKQIVHNVHVVQTLTERGAVFVDEADEVPPGALVVFSAHGVSPVVRAEARDRGLRTIDATCPLVTKVHQEAKRFAREDFDILLVGHHGHEEVEGTAGEAPSHIQLVETAADVAGVTVRDPEKVVWLSQTTLSVDETMETVRALRERFPTLQNPPSDDICYATQNRQVAVKAMAAAVRPGAGGRLDELVELGAAGGGRAVGGRRARAPDRLRPADRRELAGRGDHDRPDQRCLGTGGVGARGAGAPGRAGLGRGRGGHDRGGDPDVLVASGASSAAGPRRELTGVDAAGRASRAAAAG